MPQHYKQRGSKENIKGFIVTVFRSGEVVQESYARNFGEADDFASSYVTTYASAYNMSVAENAERAVVEERYYGGWGSPKIVGSPFQEYSVTHPISGTTIEVVIIPTDMTNDEITQQKFEEDVNAVANLFGAEVVDVDGSDGKGNKALLLPPELANLLTRAGLGEVIGSYDPGAVQP